MTAFLTEEWLAEAAARFGDLPTIAGADGVIQYVVSGAPAGKVQLHAAVRDGQLIALASGKHEQPDCTVTLSYPDAVALLAGELSVEVAFMQGRAKVDDGYPVWLLDLRPVRTTDAFAAARAELHAVTET